MRAHLVQLDIAWEDRGENFRRTTALLASVEGGAGPSPGDLVVLPEMFDSGFSFRLDVTADAQQRDGAGPTLDFLIALARRHRITLQGARTVIGPDGKGRNQAPIIGPDGTVLALYDKIHPFTIGRESEFFSSGGGAEHVLTYVWKGVDTADHITVCPAICYDLRFPELFRRGLAMGAEVFALGANWPSARAMHRLVLARARAIENQAYFFCVNRAGSDPHLHYDGGTAAFGPKGEPLGESGKELPEAQGVLTVEVDPAAVRSWRETFPAWKDGRMGERRG